MDILGFTIWREARSEGLEGMAGVYWSINNRAAQSPHNGWPNDLEKVCLQPYQFSCWNSNDPQRALYPAADDPQYVEICALIAAPPADPTNGCNSYFDVSISTPPGAVGKPIMAIGRLRFYRV